MSVATAILGASGYFKNRLRFSHQLFVVTFKPRKLGACRCDRSDALQLAGLSRQLVSLIEHSCGIWIATTDPYVTEHR